MQDLIKKIQNTGLVVKLSLVFACLILSSGCTVLALGSGGAAGAGGVLYTKGNLETLISMSPAEISRATQHAFKTLQIRHNSTQKSKNYEVKIFGMIREDTNWFSREILESRKVQVEAQAEGRGISHLSIRVGIFGNERLSREILQEIKTYSGSRFK